MNRGDLYRDEGKRLKTNRSQKVRYRARTGSGSGRHQWTQAEEEMVLSHSVPDRELAVRIGASVAAIQNRRWRLLASRG